MEKGHAERRRGDLSQCPTPHTPLSGHFRIHPLPTATPLPKNHSGACLYFSRETFNRWVKEIGCNLRVGWDLHQMTGKECTTFPFIRMSLSYRPLTS